MGVAEGDAGSLDYAAMRHIASVMKAPVVFSCSSR